MRKKRNESLIRSAKSSASGLLSKKRQESKSNCSVKTQSVNVNANVLLLLKILKF